jgi:hypothetical protein
MQIVLRRRQQGWTADFRGFTDMPNGQELPLPFSANASADMVWADIGRRFPQARLFHFIDPRCEGCSQ